MARTADQRQVVREPERAGEEHAFARWEAIGAFLRVVAGRRAVDEQFALGSRRTVPATTRESDGGRNPTRGIIKVLASSAGESYDCVKVLRSASKPRYAHFLAAPRRKHVRQRSTGPSNPNCSTAFTARSSATQAITLECVKLRRPPRHSQMPSSEFLPFLLRGIRGSPAAAPTPSGSSFTFMRRVWCSESSTSPYTSSWYCCWTAALPTRTGWEFS